VQHGLLTVSAAYSENLPFAETDGGCIQQIRDQRQRRRRWKLYSWHARKVECIGKGKAHKPYEFGVKVSVVTTNRRCKRAQFVLHAKALPGTPYDGHTLAEVIEETEALTGRAIERVYVDKGYRGHGVPNQHRVFISGQKRGVHGAIKRELRRRSAIEPVIGHMKNDGHLGRNYLKVHLGDQVNAVLSAVGYNFRLILNWLRLLCAFFIAAILGPATAQSAVKTASQRATQHRRTDLRQVELRGPLSEPRLPFRHVNQQDCVATCAILDRAGGPRSDD
jgi:IS5 family transposase